MQPPTSQRYPGPLTMEWFVLTLSVAFVALGLFALPTRPDVGVTCIAFFGVCGIVAAGTIVRKRRFARLRPLSVEIVGGVAIRPSRAYLAMFSATLLGLGVVLVAYWHSAPIAVVVSVWAMIAAGAVLLVGLLTGFLPASFLKFDPAGLTIGQRRGSFTLPWDSIAAMAPGEFHDNPVLLIWLREMDSVIVHPSETRAHVIAGLAANVKWVGAHVMIMSSQYGIDLPFLVKAIEQYAADPVAREGLAVPRLPPRSV